MKSAGGGAENKTERQGTCLIVTVNFKVGRTVIDVILGMKKPRSKEIR